MDKSEDERKRKAALYRTLTSESLDPVDDSRFYLDRLLKAYAAAESMPDNSNPDRDSVAGEIAARFLHYLKPGSVGQCHPIVELKAALLAAEKRGALLHERHG